MDWECIFKIGFDDFLALAYLLVVNWHDDDGYDGGGDGAKIDYHIRGDTLLFYFDYMIGL